MLFRSSDIMAEVNSNTSANVTMAYSQISGGFTISSKEMGADSQLKLENISGNLFSALKINDGTTNGTDLKMSVDGHIITQNTNKFTLDGIGFNVTATTDSSINFSLTRNIDVTVNAVKEFVDEYNKLILMINDKLSEKVYKDYPPLTDEQRSLLTEKQAEQWDEKAKSGILRRDSDLSGLLDRLRSSFFTVIEGTGLAMADIGIGTPSYLSDLGTYTPSVNGGVAFDEAKFRKALTDDPDKVAKMFSQASYSLDENEKINQSGLAARIVYFTTKYTTSIQSTSVQAADSAINQYNKKIDDMLNALIKTENRLYAKFTAMETAMSLYNSQSSWLTSQISSMNK